MYYLLKDFIPLRMCAEPYLRYISENCIAPDRRSDELWNLLADNGCDRLTTGRNDAQCGTPVSNSRLRYDDGGDNVSSEVCKINRWTSSYSAELILTLRQNIIVMQHYVTCSTGVIWTVKPTKIIYIFKVIIFIRCEMKFVLT